MRGSSIAILFNIFLALYFFGIVVTILGSGRRLKFINLILNTFAHGLLIGLNIVIALLLSNTIGMDERTLSLILLGIGWFILAPVLIIIRNIVAAMRGLRFKAHIITTFVAVSLMNALCIGLIVISAKLLSDSIGISPDALVVIAVPSLLLSSLGTTYISDIICILTGNVSHLRKILK